MAGQTNQLSPDAAGPGLDDRLAFGGPVIVATQLTRAVIRLGSTVVMARLLSPADYGVFGMAAVAYGFFQVGGDAGLTAAGVQRNELSPRTADALFWMQITVGVVQATLMALCGPLLADFYHEPQVARLVLPLAAALLLTNIGAQFRVHLLRDMHYPTVALIEVGGLVGATAAALFAALHGAGFWALALLVPAQEFLIAVGLVSAARWRPGRWPGREHAHGLVSIAAGATASGYANYATIFSDQFLVGRWFGSVALGLYGRAGQLATLPGSILLGPLTGWMMHALSRLQGNAGEFRQFYRRVVGGLLHACCPLGALLMAAPETCLGLLLGEKWLPAALLLRALALGLFFLPYSFADIWVLLGIGAARRLMVWSFVRFLVFAVALLLSRDGGLITVAWTMATVGTLLNLASWFVVGRVSPLGLPDFVDATWRPLALSAAWGLLLSVALARLDHPVAVIAAGVVIYTAAVAAWPQARTGIFALFELARPRRR